MIRAWRKLALGSDQRGATIVEFALIAPALCLLLAGSFDIAHTLYVRTALQGIVQKVSRDATIEGSSPTALDTKVDRQVRALVNNATVTFKRRYYRSFSQAAAAQAEIWTDLDANGKCDHGEPFVDTNENNVWDRDGGNAGQGGAKDAIVYTVAMQYPRLFPLDGFIGLSSTINLDATTILRNQPFDAQASYGAPKPGNCP